MKRTILLGLGLSAVALPAFAGGPVVPAPEPVVAPAPASFAGAYAGADLGYAFGGQDRVGANPIDRDVGEIELGGALLSLHGGYRWQQPGSRVVYGVEAMATAADVDDEVSEDGFDSSADLKWTASLRGTLGYAVRPDTLVYGFAGYTVGKADYTVRGAGDAVNEDLDLDGYVVGLGMERMITDKWSVRGEYEYTNFGKEEVRSDAGTFTTSATPDYHTLRVGVNYRF